MKNSVLSVLSILLVLAIATPGGAEEPVSNSRIHVYIGTYTGGRSEGIYLLTLNTETGELENTGLAGTVDNPSFLALHPERPLLFSVGQGVDASGNRAGMASAFAIEPGNGQLTLLNQATTVGAGPCHIAVDRAGRHALVANYSGGSLTVLPIGENGLLGEAGAHIEHEGASVHPQRQQRPHAHAVALAPGGAYVFVSDLGIDKIVIYRYDDATGSLEPNDPPFAALAPGAGPRHFAFHPTGRFAYSVNELDNTVTAFAYDADAGRLTLIHTVPTLPEGFEEENTTAEIRVHPSGRFVYASNRGHDSIAGFAVDADTGRLTPLGQTSTGGRVPRNFNISPEGRFLLAANQQTDNVVSLRIAPDTGALTPTGFEVEAPTPVCILFDAPR